MNARATRLTVAGLAGSVVLALTLHVFMLAGMSAEHPPPGGDMGSMTEAAGESAAAPVLEPPPHAAARHVLAGCFAVFAALAMLFGGSRSALQKVWPTHAAKRADTAFLLLPNAEDLPPPAGPLVAVGVLLRV